MTAITHTGLELLTVAQMAEADRLAVEAGVPFLTLMENAGRAVAEEAMKMVPLGARILVMCGPGNNGGDGFVAARLLRERGYSIKVWLYGERDKLKGAAAEMAARWTGGIADSEDDGLFSVDLIIDAVFGAGLSRPIEFGHLTDQFTRVCDTPVLAVDVPSGLNGDTGQADGPILPATRTITFFRKKPGHVLMPGRAYCGDVVVADIGIPDGVVRKVAGASRINAPEHWGWWSHLPHPTSDGHKYTRGHALVVSGPPESTGAARLGARGALRIGAGLVTVASPRAAFPVNAAHLTAIMLKPFDVPHGLGGILDDMRFNAVLIGPGCGVGAVTRDMVAIALQSGACVVLDADALTSFAVETGARAGNLSPANFGYLTPAAPETRIAPETLFELIHAANAQPPEARRIQFQPPLPEPPQVILTPHEGEFKRLFGAMRGSKLDRARAAAKLSGAIVVLKGADTVIASPTGDAAINDNAPPWLATAGSGDVLAGFVTGLLAQGMRSYEAACAAVWLHGACATAFGPGLIAEDLPEVLPKVLAKHLALDPG